MMAVKREKPIPVRDWMNVEKADAIEGAIVGVGEFDFCFQVLI